MGTEKVWGVGDDRSGSRGPGGKLDDRWLKMNIKVGKKAGHRTKKLSERQVAIVGASHGYIYSQILISYITTGN